MDADLQSIDEIPDIKEIETLKKLETKLSQMIASVSYVNDDVSRMNKQLKQLRADYSKLSEGKCFAC